MKTAAENAKDALGSDLYEYVVSTGVMTEKDLSFPSYVQWYHGDKTFREYLLPIVEYRLSLEGKYVPEMYGRDAEYPEGKGNSEADEDRSFGL